MRSFLATHMLSIQIDDPGIPPPQREHDSYLMDYILHSNHYTAVEARKLNYCRIYLNVVTVSDITRPCGDKVDPAFYTGHLTESSSRPNLMHFHQDRPSEKEWKLWRRANLLWCNIEGTLHQLLGKWLLPLSGQRRHRHAYRYRRRVWIYQPIAQQYQEYRVRSEPNPLCQQVNRVASIDELPSQAQPVEVRSTLSQDGFIIIHDGYAIVEPPTPFNRQTATFADFISTLDEWEGELLQWVTLETEPFSFCIDLQPHSKAVCDESVRNNKHSSFGWSIRNEAGQTVATGMGPAPGTKPTSYRAEAYRMLSIMRFLIRIAEFAEMYFQWQGVLGTDSQSLLDTLHGKDKDPQDVDTPIPLHGQEVVLDVLCPDWDFVKEIHASRAQLPGITLQYVKGHQDRTTAYTALDQMGQLNVDADARAAQFQDEHGAYRPRAPLMTHTRAHLIGPQGTITS